MRKKTPGRLGLETALVLGAAAIVPIVQGRKAEAQRGVLIKSTLPFGRGAGICSLATRAHALDLHPQ